MLYIVREEKLTSEIALGLGKKFDLVTGKWFTETTPYRAFLYWTLLVGGLIDGKLTDEVVGIELIYAESQEVNGSGTTNNNKIKYNTF